EQRREQVTLQRQAVGEINLQSLVDRGLGGPERVGWPVDEPTRVRVSRREHLSGGDHLINQADSQRLVGGDGAAGENQILGAGRADQTRQPLSASRTRYHPKLDLRLPQL